MLPRPRMQWEARRGQDVAGGSPGGVRQGGRGPRHRAADRGRWGHRLIITGGRYLVLLPVEGTSGSPVRVRVTPGGDGRFEGPAGVWVPDGRVTALADALGALLRDFDPTKMDAQWTPQRYTLSAFGLVPIPEGISPVPLELWASIESRRQHASDTLTAPKAELVAVYLGAGRMHLHTVEQWSTDRNTAGLLLTVAAGAFYVPEHEDVGEITFSARSSVARSWAFRISRRRRSASASASPRVRVNRSAR